MIRGLIWISGLRVFRAEKRFCALFGDGEGEGEGEGEGGRVRLMGLPVFGS